MRSEVDGDGPRWAVADLDALHAPPDRHPRRWLPGARRLLILACEIPSETYRLPVRHRTRAFRDQIRHVEQLLASHAAVLRSQGASAVALPVFFPVRLGNGRLQGGVSLCDLASDAGLGTIGRNGLLQVPGAGCRIAIGALVTNAPLPIRRPAIGSDCSGCGLCITACPAGAIGPTGVDPFRCRNVAQIAPDPIGRILRRVAPDGMAARVVEPAVNVIARYAPMPCSACVTACPRSGMEQKC